MAEKLDGNSFPELGTKEEFKPKRAKMPRSERPPRANGSNKGGGSAAAASAAANGANMDEAAPLVKPKPVPEPDEAEHQKKIAKIKDEIDEGEKKVVRC